MTLIVMRTSAKDAMIAKVGVETYRLDISRFAPTLLLPDAYLPCMPVWR